MPYDLFQITAPINRQNRDERSPCHTLARDNAAHAAVVQPLAFDARQTDVCVTGDRTHALRAEGADASEDGTGRGTPIVSCMAFAQNQLGEVRASAEVFNTINTNSNASGRNTPMLAQSMSVRRLTPTECERLQGFPDGWTAIPWKGKPASDCPDGPRYRALSNSMAVNVMRWIGRRIEMVDAL